MPVQKVPNDWGDMKNLMPDDFGTSDIPPVPVPPNFGLPDPNDPKAYNWQQWLIDLKDVPKPKYPEDIGKSLIFRPQVDNPNSESAYSVGWEIPSQILTPRNFSITGDGTAPAVPFDGTADVVFNLRNLVAEKWKTPRTITFNGTDSNGTVTLDGSADVSLALVNLQAAKWTTARTLSITGNATGSVSIDGSANVSMSLAVNFATNSTNAVNSTNATNATTADKVKAGGLTVTLTGGATGSGVSDANGNVTINTTVAGGGNPGGDTPDGKLVMGSVQQVWGRQITTGGTPTERGYITINFSPPFISADAYTYKAEVELSMEDSGTVGTVRYFTKTASQLVLRLIQGDDTSIGIGAVPLSFFIVGNIS